MFRQNSFIILLFLYICFGILVPLLAQSESPSETPLEPSLTFTETSTPTPTETLTPTATYTVEVTATPSPSPAFDTPIPESTVEIIEFTPELTAEVTELASETLFPDASPTMNLSPTPTVTPMPDRVLRGRVTYQVGQNHSGILITARDADGWQSSSTSDDLGIFNLEIYSTSGYLLEFSAPLYLSQRIWIVPGDSPMPLSLKGGDINADGCINQLDLDLLVLHYGLDNSADIDRDGQTGVADLAILTGNYDSNCGLIAELTEVAPNPEVTEVSAEATATIQQEP